jgi:N-methylhydantoinase B
MLEIMRIELQSIPNLIEADLTRTAFSPLIYEYKDYAVGLVDIEGRAIALAQQGIPSLAGMIGFAVRDGLEVYGQDRMEPGDAIVCNYAGAMGQHLNNVVMYTPIFDADGALVAFMGINVHWIDIGGGVPGSAWSTSSTELMQEGLHLRSLKLYKRGEPVEEVFRVIEYNTRQRHAMAGDIAAQYAGCVRGRALFEQLLARHGRSRLLQAVGKIWSNTENVARAAVAAVPEGTYEKSSFLDDDGVALGRRIPIDIKVHIKNGEFVVDYSGIAGQLRGPFNSGLNGGAINAANIAFKYLFAPLEPTNAGSFAPVRVIIPPGKFLSAGDKAPLGLYQTPLPTVIDTIIAAMAPVLPERVAAGHFGGVGMYGFSGRRARDGAHYSFIDTCHGGWGGSAHGDGVGPYKSILHADNKDIPVETIEALYPLRVDRFEWKQDSGGAGRQRGGLGINKTFKVLEPAQFNLAFERDGCPPWGLSGGLEGQPQSATIERADGLREPIQKTPGVPVQAGDRVHVFTGSGGGYGPPTERDPALLQRDVARGYVSLQQAENVYGVNSGAGGRTERVSAATADGRRAR